MFRQLLPNKNKIATVLHSNSTCTKSASKHGQPTWSPHHSTGHSNVHGSAPVKNGCTDVQGAINFHEDRIPRNRCMHQALAIGLVQIAAAQLASSTSWGTRHTIQRWWAEEFHWANCVRRAKSGGCPSPRSFELFSGINNYLAVFFSHNKSVNSTFSHNKPAKRTGCLFSSQV
jgi:hypothetical protein